MTIQSTRVLIVALGLSCCCLSIPSVEAENPSPLVSPPSHPPANLQPIEDTASSWRHLPQNVQPIEDNSSLLIGLPRKACEAMLCLSTIGSAPAECAEALAAYHAVSLFGGGPAFLAACPVVQ
ncbi:MAG: hypothetical protein HOO98_20225 [Nitrospira sp.]|jgi:hypothetical protein|nr:hypothetical protein [Nitrospira sp.]